jgi:hypothetical protein
MTIALWACSLPLIAEFVFAPFNLWTGRTLSNFVRYTDLPPRIATNVFAPLKLAGAVLLAAGLVQPAAGVAGSIVIAAIGATYLFRLSAPGRRHADGQLAVGLTVTLALAVLVLQIAR